MRTQNTAWAQELASNGYVVVAVDHPYDSAAVVLGDGTLLRSRLAATGDEAADDEVAVTLVPVHLVAGRGTELCGGG